MGCICSKVLDTILKQKTVRKTPLFCLALILGLKAYIESKKDIPAGAEILVDYGKDYWKVIRENMKLRADEEKEAQKKAQKKLKRAPSQRNGVKHKAGTTAKRTNTKR